MMSTIIYLEFITTMPLETIRVSVLHGMSCMVFSLYLADRMVLLLKMISLWFVTTFVINSKLIFFDLDLCPPGMKSDTGLELCKSCPKHTFTDFYGALECVSCPEGSGTLGRGSSAADDCGGIALDRITVT